MRSPPFEIRTAPHRLTLVGAVFVFGCVRGHVADTAVDVPDAVPVITAAEVTCDEAAAEWSVDVTTDAWTGNGQLVLTADGDYIEKHTLYSESAAADGSADRLGLDLDIVADWRDVSPGSSTMFNCHADGLTGILRVYTRTGGEQADCRVFGEDVERWGTWDLGVTCETPLEP